MQLFCLECGGNYMLLPLSKLIKLHPKVNFTVCVSHLDLEPTLPCRVNLSICSSWCHVPLYM